MTARQAMQKIKLINIPLAVQTAIENTQKEFIILQQQQMAAGEQRTGDPIQLSPLEWFPGYSPAYKVRREREGLETDHVNLDRTQAFYNEMELAVNGEVINITSEVDYEKWITRRFGRKIWGLGSIRMAEYKQRYFQPALRITIAEISGL